VIKDASGKERIYYGREYYWGFCDAFDDNYSDFGRLYKLIISKSNIINSIDILWTKLVVVTNMIILPNYQKNYSS